MNDIVAFADEFGNNSFDFEKQGSHFIIASIVLQRGNLEKIEAEVETIRKKYFQTGEMKSQRVTDSRRRLIILRELVKSDFVIYAVVVDKRQLYGEGFKYKGSFYKFLNGLVYKELYKTFPNLQLAVDEHGSNDFMRKFKTYVHQNHVPELFSQSEFGFLTSSKSVLIQAADFVAGTLGRCFDETKKSSDSSEFMSVLLPKITSIHNFPPQKYSFNYEPDQNDSEYNTDIAQLGVNTAREFIEKTNGKAQEEIDQLNCVKLLLLYFNYGNPHSYVLTRELIHHLQTGRKDRLTEHVFRTKVIGKLRDKGVLIVSSTAGERSGYKLPSSIADFYKFLNHGKSIILPMLKRISIFRNSVKLATRNEVDILDKSEFKALKEMIDGNN